MRKNLRVGDETITAEANAFTPILYKQLFRKDFLSELTDFMKLRGKSPEEYTQDDIDLANDKSEAITRLAFVMVEQAKGKPVKELVALTELEFFEWLSGFERNFFQDKETVSDIMALWSANQKKDKKVESKNA